MTVTASCGHVLRDDEGPDGLGHSISIKSWSRESAKSISYMCVCDKCLKRYKDDGLTLYSEDDEMKWIND